MTLVIFVPLFLENFGFTNNSSQLKFAKKSEDCIVPHLIVCCGNHEYASAGLFTKLCWAMITLYHHNLEKERDEKICR